MKAQSWATLAALLLTACQLAPLQSEHPLSGTSWALVSIQSMDDAQGTTTITEPARYTVTFAADGSARFLLDCNRGSGTWHSEQAGSESGALRFERIATTRMQCPPTALDQKLMRDMPYVRSYLLRDGRLHLGLLADGGIYAWTPIQAER